MPNSKTALASKTILIVEDEQPLLKALDEVISQAGFTTLTAADGKEALSTALKKHPDLILLDLLLPKMGGMQVLEKLRQDEWGKHVDVIILSNMHETSLIADAMFYKIHTYLVKSDIDIGQVVKKIKQTLNV